MIRRKSRTDAVPPETAIAVFERDQGCLAPRLGGSAADCAGRNRIEHVKRQSRMGRRGDLLGTLCEGHTEPGMRAGYVWCTDARNRRALRAHLLAIEADHPHVEPVHARRARSWGASTLDKTGLVWAACDHGVVVVDPESPSKIIPALVPDGALAVYTLSGRLHVRGRSLIRSRHLDGWGKCPVCRGEPAPDDLTTIRDIPDRER